MTIRHNFLILCALSLVSSTTLPAVDKEALKKKIEQDVEEKHFSHLGSMLKPYINRKLDLGWLEKVARKSDSKGFLHAVEATRNLKLKGYNLAISRGGFFKSALYMEEE